MICIDLPFTFAFAFRVTFYIYIIQRSVNIKICAGVKYYCHVANFLFFNNKFHPLKDFENRLTNFRLFTILLKDKDFT